MHKLPEECQETITHMLTHLRSAMSAFDYDRGLVKHDLDIAIQICENMLEKDEKTKR